jgi:hypothetical protein
MISRSRRFTRLRTTAPPTRLLTEKPIREDGSTPSVTVSARAYPTMSNRPWTERPRRRTR